MKPGESRLAWEVDLTLGGLEYIHTWLTEDEQNEIHKEVGDILDCDDPEERRHRLSEITGIPIEFLFDDMVEHFDITPEAFVLAMAFQFAAEKAEQVMDQKEETS